MNFYGITALINALGATFFGLFAYFKNRKGLSNRVLLLNCTFTAIWGYSYFIWQISNTEESALFWSRALMAGAVFITVSYVHLILAIINKIKEQKIVLILGYTVFFLFFSFKLH